MEVIPEIELWGGRAVLTNRGSGAAPHDIGDPVDVALALVDAGATRVHVIDVSGAIAGHPAHDAMVRAIAAIVKVQYGGGLRTAVDIARAWDLGVERVVVGSAAVDDPSLLRSVDPSRLVVAVDVVDGHVTVHGRADVAQGPAGAFVGRLADSGVQRVLVTSVERQGTLRGPDLAVLADLAMQGAAVLAHGGVGSIDHLSSIGRLPAIEGVVVGRALHEGAFTYREAVVAVGQID